MGEFTWRAVVLGVILALLLGAANMYVGLRVGLTISASIPAAVMSMGILRLLRKSNVLENNIVQTFAASGEAVAAGIIFTIPALLILNDPSTGVPIWSSPHARETLVIGLAGGLLGVLFCIPLRRAFVVEGKLAYPEGVACAEVLRAGESGGSGAKILVGGLLLGAFYAFLQGSLRLWRDAVEGATRIGQGVAYLGTGITPILAGVGYIVGLRVGLLLILGGGIAWFVLIPLFLTTGIPGLVAATPYPELSPLDAAYEVWTTKIRLIGGGAMITGGLFTLYKARSSLVAAFNQSRQARADKQNVPETDRDLPLNFIIGGSIVLALVIGGLFWTFTGNVTHALIATLVMLVAGFFFSAVAGYMAGVVGSSNNPISGVTIVTLITSSLLLVALGANGAEGMLAALGIGAIIAVAGAIAGDTLQDLKTGHLVGATPWKQQVAQMLGVVSFAVVAPFVLGALVQAYGIGGPDGLAAPQAFLMSRILQGIFGATLDWNLVGIGAALGVVFVIARLPVMAVAVGMYLPLPTTLPIMIGGGIAWLVERRASRGVVAAEREEKLAPVRQRGLLFASGLIAGEAIMGIVGAALILQDSGGPRYATAVASPIILALLLATAFAVFFSGRWRLVASGLAVALGGALAFVIWSQGIAYGFVGGAVWPGVLAFAYVLALIAYVPLRETLVWKQTRTP